MENAVAAPSADCPPENAGIRPGTPIARMRSPKTVMSRPSTVSHVRGAAENGANIAFARSVSRTTSVE
jgi:hypothetical protein